MDSKIDIGMALFKHKIWLESNGENGEQANFSGTDLRGANLWEANLWGANLSGANLCRAILCRANLSGADLSGVNLSWANLSGADLSGVNLSWANLGGANLNGANLSWANLCEANLNGANLCEANLSWANLSWANLGGANLNGANLCEANLSGAEVNEVVLAKLFVPPEEGSFIGWKKCENYIIKLRIPEDAKRSSATTRKCRCSKAEVLDIQMMDGTSACLTELEHHAYDHVTIYKKGEMVYPDSFDENRWNECSHGIHFFITRAEAVAY